MPIDNRLRYPGAQVALGAALCRLSNTAPPRHSIACNAEPLQGPISINKDRITASDPAAAASQASKGAMTGKVREGERDRRWIAGMGRPSPRSS